MVGNTAPHWLRIFSPPTHPQSGRTDPRRSNSWLCAQGRIQTHSLPFSSLVPSSLHQLPLRAQICTIGTQKNVPTGDNNKHLPDGCSETYVEVTGSRNSAYSILKLTLLRNNTIILESPRQETVVPVNTHNQNPNPFCF